jgi:hypothetical protein
MLHSMFILTIRDIQSLALHKMKRQNRKYIYIYIYIYIFFLWGSSVGIGNDYGVGTQSLIPSRGSFFSMFTTASRLTLGPIFLNEWVPSTLSPGIKCSGHQANHLSRSSDLGKECVQLYFHFPIRIYSETHLRKTRLRKFPA